MKRTRKNLLLALKIGLGSSLAIIIAQSLHLEYAVSAGTVTLLTLMTSKWETIRLSVSRLATFALTAVLAWVIFHLVDSMWVTYGLLLTLVVFIAETCGWRSTISVNSVAVAHLVTAGKGLTVWAIWNELQLVLIGVVIAVVLNLFHANLTHKREIVAAMRETESRLQSILRGLADEQAAVHPPGPGGLPVRERDGGTRVERYLHAGGGHSELHTERQRIPGEYLRLPSPVLYLLL